MVVVKQLLRYPLELFQYFPYIILVLEWELVASKLALAEENYETMCY
jgi:hypothetical protein